MINFLLLYPVSIFTKLVPGQPSVDTTPFLGSTLRNKLLAELVGLNAYFLHQLLRMLDLKFGHRYLLLVLLDLPLHPGCLSLVEGLQGLLEAHAIYRCQMWVLLLPDYESQKYLLDY